MSEDYGAKVSLPGFDVGNAGDQNLYFNSSWPLLKIDEALSGTMTLTGTPADIINHKLGYPPFVMVWSKTNGFWPYYIDKINATFVSFNGQPSTDVGDKIRYYIFRNPLNINFQAPNINLAEVKAGTNKQDFGIKFAKENKNAESTDLRDFTIHSGTKSLQVHQVIYQQLATFNDTEFGLPDLNTIGMKYLTDLPYRPVYFAYYSSDNINFVPIFAAAQTAPKVVYNSIDGGIIITDGVGGSGWGVLYVLLDPYQSTTQINKTL